MKFKRSLATAVAAASIATGATVPAASAQGLALPPVPPQVQQSVQNAGPALFDFVFRPAGPDGYDPTGGVGSLSRGLLVGLGLVGVASILIFPFFALGELLGTNDLISSNRSQPDVVE